jgi:hypothetical protein
MRALTEDEWKKKAHQVHGNKYNYTKTVYLTSRAKVKIICPQHGIFDQLGNNHLAGRGCPKCGNTTPHTMRTFLAKAVNVHGTKNDYSKVKQVNGDARVRLICPQHGVFTQTVKSHLTGKGCPSCAVDSRTDTLAAFVEKARVLHGQKYDYSHSVYLNTRTKLTIICEHHGPFQQTPNQHQSAESDCPQCAFHERVKFRRKTVIRCGRKFVLQGYEPQALDWMLTKVSINEVKHGKDVPTVNYVFSGKSLRYYPDFWLPSKNRLVEVKSVYTLGLRTSDQVFNQNKAKRRAAIKAGYNFTLLVFDKEGRKLTLPKNWWQLKKPTLKYLLEKQCAI